MTQYADLKLKAVAIGSLPHKDIVSAMNVVEKNFSEIPFFPQLVNLSKKEGILNQIKEGLPSFSIDDYNQVISGSDGEILEKYAFTKDCLSTFESFEEVVKKTNPKFAKGQLVGVYTSSLPAQFLSLKALWMIKHIKAANSAVIPIIFIDEPAFQSAGGVNLLSGIVRDIQQNGAICAIHCCRDCNWEDLISVNPDIISFDAYRYFDNILSYSDVLKEYLESGKGMLSWGIVPTVELDVLKRITVDELEMLFDKYVKYLTNAGIDETLIIDNSLITSSCGAGHLTVELAQRAMDLVFGLSERLKKRF